MDIRILGPLEVADGGRPVPLGAPKQRALLASLVLHPNEVVPVDRIIDEVWGDLAPRTAHHSVQLYVSELRRAFGDGPPEIVTVPPGYELRIEADAIDATQFEHFTHDGLEALVDDPSAALLLLEEALALWRGPALSDVAYDEFAQSEIRRLEDLRLDAEDARDEACILLGRHRSVVANLRKRVEDHPLRERTRELYMRALAGVGRQADALRTFQDIRRVLGVGLGIEPGPGLQRLEEQILLQDPALRPVSERSSEATATRNPYKGLRPFVESDAADFFGRSDLTARLVEALDRNRFVAVVGPSGSGKSSVVQAGLMPALRADRNAGRIPVVMVPGSSPFAAAEAALVHSVPNARSSVLPPAGEASWLLRAAAQVLPDGSELVLVIDQFEELYTLSGAQQRGRFLDCLRRAALDPTSRIRVVVALRADFYDRPLASPEFGALFSSHVVHVMPMTAAELGAAASEPAAAAGLTIEPALMAELVADAADQPGGLPLFQFALAELADRRVGDTLGVDAYRAMGGLRGALVGRAEEVLEGLDADRREATRQLALRLITIEGHAGAARRRVEASELTSLTVDAISLRTVLEQFGRHRLLTFDRNPVTGSPTVEFAHDALLITWGRLQSWIEASRGDLRRHGALAVAVDEWLNADRDSDYLPTGTQFGAYEEWLTGTTMKLTETELEFLGEARRLAAETVEAQQQIQASHLRLQRRARTRLWALAMMGLVLIVAAVSAFVLTRPQGPRIALVFEGRDFDFGRLAAQGWDRADRSLEFRPEEVVPLSSPKDDIRNLASSGYDQIVVLGTFFAADLETVAPDFPDTTFVVLDADVDLPNVTSINFRSEEGSFLVGAAAALASKTGVVGFVGGTPIPIIEEFRAGFEAGAYYVDADVEVVATYVSGDLNNAFIDPAGGRAAADRLFQLGVDVVYHAAGGSGWGVVDAARVQSIDDGDHRWVIGVDSDQYLLADDLQRPYLLTSMVKRIDVGLELVVTEFVSGEFRTGRRRLGLAEGALHLSETGGNLDPYLAELAEIEMLIVGGDITVPTVPEGVVVPIQPHEYDLSMTISFEDGTCTFEGPRELSQGAVVGIVGDSSLGEAIWMGLVPVVGTPSLESLPSGELTGSHREFLLVDRAIGALVDGAGDYGTVTEPLSVGTYAVYCVVSTPEGDQGVPAAVVEVR